MQYPDPVNWLSKLGDEDPNETLDVLEIEEFPQVEDLYRDLGLTADKPEPLNPEGRDLAMELVDLFLSTPNNPYHQLYNWRFGREDPKLTPLHRHFRTRRWLTKLFLSHLHEVVFGEVPIIHGTRRIFPPNLSKSA